MKVLQVGRYYPPHMGGIETVMYEMTEGLNNNGVSCDVLCSNKIRKTEISYIKNYKVTRVSSLGNLFSTSISPKFFLELKNIIRDYDIIHLHHPDPMATVALLLCNPKQKIVVHWHSDIIRQKLALFFYKPIQNLILKRCHKIIATSQNYVDGSPHLKKYKDKVEVIPIGIQANFRANELRSQQLSNEYKNKQIIFSLGRHVYYKGFEYLVEAAQHLDDSFLILLGGTGPLSNSFRKKINSLNLSNKIHLVGEIPQSEVASFFQSCTIFCLPSIERTEAFGVVLIEAMSFGKPLVATNIPGSGVSWVNQHDHTGLNVAPMNSKELADAFVKISSDNELLQLFQTQSKLRYTAYFSREPMIHKLKDLYSRIHVSKN